MRRKVSVDSEVRSIIRSCSRATRATSLSLVLVAALACANLACRAPAQGATFGPIAFVPLDDRPVTLQLPQMLGAIAGQSLLVPPRASIGWYLQPGDPDAIAAWLRSDDVRDVSALVVSTDMAVYGGLVASRVPGLATGRGLVRLDALAAFKREHPRAFVGAFGTIMRLAPTGVPRLPSTAGYWATGETVDLIQQYANLPDPLQTDEQRAFAARLRERIGPAVLDAYLGARARNRDVDEYALQLAADGAFDRIVLGQDDAGPVGLHLRDVAALQRDVRAFGLDDRASIEPGADELGMVVLARAFARNAGWTPSVRVVYSRADAPAYHDHLEFVPIDVTISRLIEASGATRVVGGGAADVTLYVKAPETNDDDERRFEDALAADVAAGGHVAVADLSFLSGGPGPAQRELTDVLIARSLAGKLDAFASWNTNANTVGTALAAAIAAGAGRRTGRFDALAHAQFMLDRYADDYAFHQFVRPALNETLRARGIDTTLLVPEVALEASSLNRALLWPQTLDLLHAIYPQYADRGLAIALPWDRTFETRLDVRLGAAAEVR